MKKPLFTRWDPLLVTSAGLILIFGLFSLYSIDPELARVQLLFALLGGLGFFLFSILDYRHLKTGALPLFILTIALLWGVLIWGKEVGGAYRWFSVGPFFFTPSELAKPSLIILLAAFFSRLASPLKLRDLLLGVLPAAILSMLVFFQPSLGTALVFVAIWVGLVWVAGISYPYLFGGLLLLFISLPILWGSLQDYQQERITSFLNPVLDPLGAGYNVIQSMIAVGSGRFLGKGFGMGTQSHLRFLPVRHTDFIFASLTEEWGLLGASLLLLLYLVLLWRILRIATSQQDKFGFFLGIGVFAFLFTQVVINVGMNVGIAPITGLPLPLVSYGGSSLLFTLICVGVVHSLVIHQRGRA